MAQVPTVDVTDNPQAARYELRLDGRLAGRVDYLVGDGGTIDMTYAQVDPELRGRGLGEALVGRAVDDARGRGLEVIGSCSFVAAYLRRHPSPLLTSS